MSLAAVEVEPGARTRRVAFLGNPNAGKSTLFNQLTGARVKVGNYAGITVERVEGRLVLGDVEVVAVDLPGTFSLSARSPDERIAIDILTADPPPDAVVLVADAPRLLRSLYLVLQVLELRVPVLVVLNMMDEARALGREPDIEAVAAALGVPVVGVVARTGEGVPELRAALAEVLATHEAPGEPHSWPASVVADVDEIAAALPEAMRRDPSRARAVARWALLSVDDDDQLGNGLPRGVIDAVRARAEHAGRDLEAEVVQARYGWIDARERSFLGDSVEVGARSDRLDRVLLHPLWGTVVFFAVMAVVFQALFSWSDPFIGLIEGAFGLGGGAIAAGFEAVAAAVPAIAGPVDLLGSLVVDGVIGGVGAVVVFLPQIAFLSLFVALMEEVGYLARAAYLMDRLLRLAGLPGRAFVPMLSGYACAVPAIMATRTMPRFRDRLLTMMVVPLTSCSARLPVYALLITVLFAGGWFVRPAALFGMYLFSTVVALLAAVVLGRTLLRDQATPEILELPPYRLPSIGRVLQNTWQRCWGFLREAGGIILVATVILWGLFTFPRVEEADLYTPEEVAALEADGVDVAAAVKAAALEQSFAGRVGRFIEPAIEPLGFDWRIGIGLIGSFAAREVFVSTMGLVYGVGEVDESTTDLQHKMQSQRRADGSPVYSPLVGVSLMVFFALAMQCLSTLAVIKRESKSWRWPAFTFLYMTTLAWVAAFIVYQGGKLLGFG